MQRSHQDSQLEDRPNILVLLDDLDLLARPVGLIDPLEHLLDPMQLHIRRSGEKLSGETCCRWGKVPGLQGNGSD